MALPQLESVYRIARRLAGNDHEAEDLVQETYLKAYRAFAGFEMREFGIRPWLIRILNNTFLNRRARERRAPQALDQRALEFAGGADASPPAGPPDLDYEHVDGELKLAIEALAPEFRTVLLLWATSEYSYQEIADILSLPIGTVMSRLHRARQQLTRSLHDYARDKRLIVEKSVG